MGGVDPHPCPETHEGPAPIIRPTIAWNEPETLSAVAHPFDLS